MSETSDEVLDIPADDVAVAGGGELEYAGFWSRVAALIVDNAIVTIFGLALLIAAGFVGAGAVVIANLAFFLVAILYWPLMECSERQATIGKQLLGIQVTDANGARLTFVRSLLRNLAKIISSLPFGLGFLLAAFTARKQALHDMITKCLVVRAGPSHFLKAVLATVGALLISIGGGYYYFAEVFLPQMTQEMAQQMEKAQKGAPAAKPAPAQPPVAQAPTPAPAPAAQPAPEKTAPGEPKLMTPQEIAEFEKKVGEAKREPAKVAVVTPPAPASTPAPAQKPAAPAPAKPAAAEIKPAPAKPASAPVAKEPAPTLAAAPAAKAKPEPKPTVVPAAKPKPAPATAVEVPTALVSEPPAPPPPPAPTAAPRKPAESAVVAVAPAPRPARSPKFSDVMTAVMYQDVAAAAELLELGWWADRPDSNGVTPLMAAAWNGDPAMAQLLLKGGADPNRRGPGGSVLDYAGRGGDILVVELLKLSGAR
jgi:uncharacterized RDD family membrane protein YckC